jgi:hypothetical protein
VHFERKRCSRDLTALRNRYADTLLVFFYRTAASRAGEFHSRDALFSFIVPTRMGLLWAKTLVIE